MTVIYFRLQGGFLSLAYSVEEVGEYARKELDHVKTTCCSSIK